jgi:hypothetical protein
MGDWVDEIERRWIYKAIDLTLDESMADMLRLIAEVRRLRVQLANAQAMNMPVGTPERRDGEPTLYVADSSEEPPVYNALGLYFNTPPKKFHIVKAVVTCVDRPGPPYIIDDEDGEEP